MPSDPELQTLIFGYGIKIKNKKFVKILNLPENHGGKLSKNNCVILQLYYFLSLIGQINIHAFDNFAASRKHFD